MVDVRATADERPRTADDGRQTTGEGGVRVVPLVGMRRMIAQRMQTIMQQALTSLSRSMSTLVLLRRCACGRTVGWQTAFGRSASAPLSPPLVPGPYAAILS